MRRFIITTLYMTCGLLSLLWPPIALLWIGHFLYTTWKHRVVVAPTPSLRWVADNYHAYDRQVRFVYGYAVGRGKNIA